MVICRRPAFRVSLIGLLALLALGLALPQPRPAYAQAVCRDGFALWANSATRSETLLIGGSNSTIRGAIRSNADLKLSGSNNQITGAVTYGAGFEDGGDANRYPQPTRVAAATPPLSYDIADYQPQGAIARAAIQAGRYTEIRGDFDVSEPTTLSGLYYVTGNAKLAASNITGAFTIVAAGTIDVSGSTIRATPYADGLLLFANHSEPGGAVIKLAGSDSDLRGVIYGPRGMVELSGSAAYTGLILGDTLSLSGSSLQIAFTPAYCPGASAPGNGAGAYTPGEVVLKLRNAADLGAVAAAYNLRLPALDQFGTRPIYRLRIDDNATPPLKAQQLLGDPRVEYAEPNYLAQDPESRRGRGSWVLGGDAAGYAGQWVPALIGLPAAHTVSRGAGVTIAILDTGIDASHPALAGRLVPGFDFVNFDDNPREEGTFGVNGGFGHGTHVAGLAALAAPEAKIMPVRVLDVEGVGNIWVLAEGLLFAAELGRDGVPLSGDEAQVINLSLGTLRPTQLLQDLVREVTCAADNDDDDDSSPICANNGGAGRVGAVVIAAAGNGGDNLPQYPAAEDVPGALALGASTRDDTRADFSTYGSWVRLAAPGAEVISTVPGGSYGTWSGTSMAAPLAAGVAALVRAAEPGLDSVAITARLVETGQPIRGEIPRRLDAAAAVGASRPTPSTGGRSVVWLPIVMR